MRESRKQHNSWYAQEQSDIREAEAQKPAILDMFWNERVLKRNRHSIGLIKGFLKGRPPKIWDGKKISRDEWSKIVDNQFTKIIRKQDKQQFIHLFQHISGRAVQDIDKGEKFGITNQVIRVETSKNPSAKDKAEIQQYMTDKNMSAAVLIRTDDNVTSITSEETSDNSVYSIHSVGKMFTGVIILELINRGILSESALKKPIELSDSAKRKLPKEIVERLKSVTLLDIMLHKGGFGDFVGKYVATIQSALRWQEIEKSFEEMRSDKKFGLVGDAGSYYDSNTRPALQNRSKLPEINHIEDFLKFAAASKLSEPGVPRYSNLGSLLVGLAAEHAYADHQRNHPDQPALDFNGLLREFIQKPAGMNVLSDKAPLDVKVNDSDSIEQPTPEARHLVGNPSGGYWTSVSDLAKFGIWLSDKCKEPTFGRLVQQYGQEFHLDDHTLGHKGESPSASAMLSINLNDGRVIAALSNSGRNDAHELEEAVRTNVFTKPVMNIQENSVIDTMTRAGVPAVSIAYVADGDISEKHLTSEDSNYPATHETMYGAASLSKPVFAYLVLKLIQSGEFSLDSKITDLLPFDQFCNPDGKRKFTHDGSVTKEILDSVTVKMLLSHTSGLNLGSTIGSQFPPGSQYSYSNLGLYYLQKAVERQTGKDLQKLAKEMVFDKLHMNNSCYYRSYNILSIDDPKREPQTIYIQANDKGLSYEVIGLDGELRKGNIPWKNLPENFPHDATLIIDSKNEYLSEILNHTSTVGYTTLSEAVAVNSLFTTAHDYAVFVNAWMNDESELMQSAFNPVIFMTTDDWAKKMKIPEDDLKNVAWGLGWGLQMNPEGKRPHAYHTADMNMWRAEVAIDLNNKRAIVYFANSPNGHILANQIIMPNVKINHALNYFFQKYGFARHLEANWQAKEETRMQHIGTVVNTRNLVKSEAAKIDATETQSQRLSSTARLQKNMPASTNSTATHAEKTEIASPSQSKKSTQPTNHDNNDMQVKKTHNSPTPYKRKLLPPGYKE